MAQINPGIVTLQILNTTDSLHRSTWIHNLFYFCQQNEEFHTYNFKPTIYGAKSNEYADFLNKMDNEEFITIKQIPLNHILYGDTTIGENRELPLYKITERGEKVLKQVKTNQNQPISPTTINKVNTWTQRDLNNFLRFMSNNYPECFREKSRYNN